MISKKNKNQAFVYEEEFNQSNDSLEKNKNPKFIIGNEELFLDQEKSKLLLNLIKNVYPSETQVNKIKKFKENKLKNIKIEQSLHSS